ncbi:hypothetical protein E3P99_03600 [Wallemia hederae]|uniref:G-patch domain-containing protein n=1 Tax=Wallemia hederae TaxID=1540922 RepID=A0A4T0FFA4_9BASI|nr:hypothetical protein E3P99_03600 [Wallemia hederae]
MSKYNVFGGDDSEDEDNIRDEVVTGFDGGVLKSKEHRERQQPLIIPSQANIDWREKKKSKRYRPNEEQPAMDSSASDTREKLNDGPQRVGLQSYTNVVKEEDDKNLEDVQEVAAESEEGKESVDEQALKSLLLNAKPVHAEEQIEAIPMTAPGLSDADAFKEDVAARAEESTLEEYSRVPVDQFGAALLRGMGWKEGTAASRTRTGPTEPYLPDSRPSLLGIGASARPANDKDKKASSKEIRMRKQAMTSYRPLTKQAKEGSSPNSARSRRSQSPQREKKPYGSSSKDYDRYTNRSDRREGRSDNSRRYDERADSSRDDRRYDDRRRDNSGYERRRDFHRDERRHDDRYSDRVRHSSERSSKYYEDRRYHDRH